MRFEALPWFVHDQIIAILGGEALTVATLNWYWRSRAMRFLVGTISTRRLEGAPDFKRTMSRIARFIGELQVCDDLYTLDPVLRLCFKLKSIVVQECHNAKAWPVLLRFFARLHGIKSLRVAMALGEQDLQATLFRFPSLVELRIDFVLTAELVDQLTRFLSKCDLKTLEVYVCLCSIECINQINAAAPSLVRLAITCDHFIRQVAKALAPFPRLESFQLDIRASCMAVLPFIRERAFPRLKRCRVSNCKLLFFGTHGLSEPLPGLVELSVKAIPAEFVKSSTCSYASLAVLDLDLAGLPFYAIALLLTNIQQVRRLALAGIGSCDRIFRLPTRSLGATHVTLAGITSHNYLAYSWVAKSFPCLQFLDMDFGPRDRQLYWPGDPALPTLSATAFCLKSRGRRGIDALVGLARAMPALKYMYISSILFRKRVPLLLEKFPHLECFPQEEGIVWD